MDLITHCRESFLTDRNPRVQDLPENAIATSTARVVASNNGSKHRYNHISITSSFFKLFL
jgi:hypothetical protein